MWVLGKVDAPAAPSARRPFFRGRLQMPPCLPYSPVNLVSKQLNLATLYAWKT